MGIHKLTSLTHLDASHNPKIAAPPMSVVQMGLPYIMAYMHEAVVPRSHPACPPYARRCTAHFWATVPPPRIHTHIHTQTLLSTCSHLWGGCSDCFSPLDPSIVAPQESKRVLRTLAEKKVAHTISAYLKKRERDFKEGFMRGDDVPSSESPKVMIASPTLPCDGVSCEALISFGAQLMTAAQARLTLAPLECGRDSSGFPQSGRRMSNCCLR